MAVYDDDINDRILFLPVNDNFVRFEMEVSKHEKYNRFIKVLLKSEKDVAMIFCEKKQIIEDLTAFLEAVNKMDIETLTKKEQRNE